MEGLEIVKYEFDTTYWFSLIDQIDEFMFNHECELKSYSGVV